MARDNKKSADAEEGAPAWMCTFADLMSLLLCFFVLLLSFSTMSEEKFERAMASLHGAFSIFPKNTSIMNPMPKVTRRTQRSVEKAARRLQRRMQMRDKQNDVRVEFDKQGGLKIVLANKVLFDTAMANLKQDAFGVLSDLADVLGDFPTAKYEVRGHSDSRPLRGHAKYRDNHDLSWARADSVARFIAGTGSMALDNLEITGCGPGQPIALNDTPEGMQANRRVEIHVRGLTDDTEIGKLQEELDTGTDAEVTSLD